MKLFEGIVSFTGLSVIASALSFAFMLLAMSTLGLEKYGIFVLFLAVSNTIQGVSSSQSWQGISRYFFNGFEGENAGKIFFSLMLIDVINVAIAFCAIFVATNLFPSILIFPDIGILIFFLIVPKLISVPLGLIRVMDHFVFLGWNMIACQGLKLLGLLYLAFLSENRFELIDVVILYLATEWLFLMVNLCRILKDSRFTNFLSRSGINAEGLVRPDKDAVKFQAICHANSASVLSIRYLDEIIVGIYLSTEVLGFWKLLKMLSGILGKIIEPMYLFVFPKLESLDVMGKDKKTVLRILGKCKKYLVICSGLTIGLIAMAIGLDDEVEFPLDYISAGIIVLWVSMVNLIYFFSHPLAIRCRGEKKVLALNLFSGGILGTMLLVLVKMDSLFLISVALAVYCSINHYGRLTISRKFINRKS